MKKNLAALQKKYGHKGNKVMHEGPLGGTSNKKTDSMSAMSGGSTQRNVGPGNGKKPRG